MNTNLGKPLKQTFYMFRRVNKNRSKFLVNYLKFNSYRRQCAFI